MRTQFVLFGLLALLSACATDLSGPTIDDESVGTSQQALTTLEGAASLGWTGVVDTDLPIGAVLPLNHTIVAKFTLQYMRAQPAPILSARSRSDLFSLTYEYLGEPYPFGRLVFTVGGKRAVYWKASSLDKESVPSESPSLWHDLAVVRSGGTFVVYLDGYHLQGNGDVNAAGDLIAPTSNLPPFGDTLRLGRNSDFDSTSQLYGIVDDVAIFNSALGPAELKTLRGTNKVNPTDPRLSGYYSFDFNAPALGTWVYRTATLSGAAQRRLVTRNSTYDKASLLPPQNQTVMELPFEPNDIYLVQAGPGEAPNVGLDAFAWDFVRIGPQWTEADIQANTVNQPLFSSAAGTVVFACDQGWLACNAGQLAEKGPLIDGYNTIVFEHAPGEFVTFGNVFTDSVRTSFQNLGYLLNPSSPGAPVVPVGKHIHVANIGTSGTPADPLHFHLHYAFGPRGMTVPMAFSHYEASDDGGKTWQLVERGIPRPRQWIRNVP